jgi:peptide/nickel transport system permease protein
MTGIRDNTEENAGGPVMPASRRLRTIGSAIVAILLIGIVFASMMMAPYAQHLSVAKALDATLAGDAICARHYAVVPYGETVDIYGDEVLVAETPESGTRGMIFRWTIDDGGVGTARGQFATYTWSHIGVWNATLTVINKDLEMSTDTMVVRVVPHADGGSDRVIWENDYANLNVTLNGSDSDSDFPIISYDWTFQYQGAWYNRSGMSMTFNFTKPGFYTVQLKVVDSEGNVGFGNTTVHIKRLPTFYEEHWMFVFIGLPVIAIIALMIVSKIRRDKSLFTATDREKVRLQVKNGRKTWKIFKANRLGFAGFIILIIFLLMAIFAPWISTVKDPNNINNFESNHPDDGWMNPLPPSLKPSPYTGLVHPFGTDHTGKDVYSLTMYGARASLEVGVAATLISVVVGAAVGLSAGYFGRVTDEVLMRMTDFFLVIPWFPLMIVMMAILGQKFIWVVVVIGITSWPSTARIVRSQVLTVKERQFIVRAKCVGAPDSHILRTHIMPNVLPLIFANTVLLVAIAIFNEAFLDFFGLGDPTVISWGTMLEGAYERDAFVAGAWWWIIAPGAAIVIIVLAFSLVGYAIDDVLNPKLRRR